MGDSKIYTLDGNEAVSTVAYRLSEVISIYPITPSSPMAEWADDWSAVGKTNLWGNIPSIMEMQSESGASGAMHGALQAGSMCTTFTASQGLLLMIPDMFKIAGELTPVVMHVTARTLATHALSIFGDHSDVMAVRSTGFALLCSNSVQETMDMALVAHAATLNTRVSFLHFFDGFRTSHEVAKVHLLPDDTLRAVIDMEKVAQHRERALSPDHPMIRGTAQNPDVFFQAREASNLFYLAVPDEVQKVMDKVAQATGRAYHLFDYHGAPDAERVIVIMGSGAEIVHETIDALAAKGEKVGVVKVRLFRPFSIKHFVAALPPSVKSIAVLDRTKEPGAAGEPLYQDILTALDESLDSGDLKSRPRVIGGRYGLSSKEFTPAMVKGVYDHMKEAKLRNHFTVGINDDVTHLSLPYDKEFTTEPKSVSRSLFYGLGADGTVGANKNSIKIIGENTDNWAQGYFVYDSKKSGAMTVSHLRFGPNPLHSSYLITRANFVGCHQPQFIDRYDMLANLVDGGTFLYNTASPAGEVWASLPRLVQEQLQRKKAKFHVIDAYKVARETGMGARINTIMQVCFFAISGVLPREQAIEAIKQSIIKTYQKKGDEIVQANLKAVDQTIANLHEVPVAGKSLGNIPMHVPVPEKAPAFVKEVLGKIIEGNGDDLPVSAMPVDGTFPTGTTQYEKRRVAQDIPVWDPEICIQCARCSLVCPHGTIRVKVYEPAQGQGAPSTFKSMEAKHKDWKGMKFTIQVAPEDCTGCGLCVDICPGKSKTDPKHKSLNMKPMMPLVDEEARNWDFFLKIPLRDPKGLNLNLVMQQQLQMPYFEFSGACTGCGETPYVKLMSQLFGDRLLIGNATGCSSIYGGNLPTTPWSKDDAGRGPVWSNSLFENNAEFALGMRLSVDQTNARTQHLLKKLESAVGADLVNGILTADQSTFSGIEEQRFRVRKLQKALAGNSSSDAKELVQIADYLVKKSVWALGGDGWAYDIGYGGLDHVLATGRNINVLVLDTEVYSNTGGQMSKSTPIGAVAKFAAAGKAMPKKDLGLIAMTYGNIYVARVAMGASDSQTLKAFVEAESYDGPSLIIAYSHCIAHGYDLVNGLKQQKAAVQSGQWLMYRYDPRLTAQGKNPLLFDSPEPTLPLEEYMTKENRFKILMKAKPEEAKRMMDEGQKAIKARYHYYKQLASPAFVPDGGSAPAAPAPPAQA